MPRQNRVLPTGEIVALPTIGTFMGNRGILHDAAGELGNARWRIQAWVTCLLDFKGRKREVMKPGCYTELFFMDEAVALAAGHRPCGECRRADYLAFKDAARVSGPIGEFDKVLHKSRVNSLNRAQRRFDADIDQLPDGTFILNEQGTPCLIHARQLWPFGPEGYGPEPKPAKGMSNVTVLTPRPTVQALHAGYKPLVALDF